MWISLYTDLDVSIVLSLFVGFASISFTFFRILYFNHTGNSREKEKIIAKRLHKRQRQTNLRVNYHKQSSSIITSAPISPSDDDQKYDKEEEEKEEKKEKQEKEQKTAIEENERTPTITLKNKEEPELFHARSRSETLRLKATEVAKSRTCHNLWRNFICCYPVKMLVNRLVVEENTKRENQDRKTDPNESTWKNKLYYLNVYLWVITDFGIRIFPILACARLRQQYLEFLAVMFGLTLFEFIFHYYMLMGEFKTPRYTTHFFWTLYFTVSYCFLSTMHLTYLPANVVFDRLMVEHCLRMLIQAAFMILAMIIQHYEYGHIFGFFENSIIIFWIVWITNWILTFVVRKGYKQLEEKIKIAYYSTRDLLNTPDSDIEMTAMD